jgi:hypothetical protein
MILLIYVSLVSVRQQNIERNNAFLKEIGLDEVKRNLEQTTVSPKSPKSKSKRKLKETTSADGEGNEVGNFVRRKSTRLSKSPEDLAVPLLELSDSFSIILFLSFSVIHSLS